jgi:hypothetical protein
MKSSVALVVSCSKPNSVHTRQGKRCGPPAGRVSGNENQGRWQNQQKFCGHGFGPIYAVRAEFGKL